MTRLYGRGLRGERVYEAIPGRSWTSTTVLSAIHYTGRTESMMVSGATDAVVFEVFIKKVLCPKLKKTDIVIMDNLPAHKGPEIRNAIESKGAKLLYLPPYSPDFNPIEKMWSKVKAYLRKIKGRSEEEITKALAEVLRAVTRKDAFGWYHSCGYVLIDS